MVMQRAVWASCCSVHPQNKEPSVGILLGPELGLAQRGSATSKPSCIFMICSIRSGLFSSCPLLFLCFSNSDTPVRTDGSRGIIRAVIESRCFVPNSRSPVLAPMNPHPPPPTLCPCLDVSLFMFSLLSSLIISFGIFLPPLWEFMVTTDGECQR